MTEPTATEPGAAVPCSGKPSPRRRSPGRNRVGEIILVIVFGVLRLRVRRGIAAAGSAESAPPRSAPAPSRLLARSLALLLFCGTAALAEVPELGEGPARWVPLLSQDRPPSLIVEDAYRTTLRLWAHGERRAATEARLDLTWRFQAPGAASREFGARLDLAWRLVDRSAPSRTCLDRTREQTTDRLMQEDPRLLLAVLDFEMTTWRGTSEGENQRLYPLLFGQLEEELDDRFPVVGIEPDQVARWFLGWSFVLDQSGILDLLRVASEDLDRALGWFPRSRALLHRSGILHERLGQAAAARDRFLRLLELDPEDVHARLHAAVLGARSGSEAARDELTRISEAPGPPWTRELALAILARLELDAGRRHAALHLARLGVERYPESRLHSVLLAYLLPPNEAEDISWSVTAADGLGSTDPVVVKYELGHRGLLDAEIARLNREMVERRTLLRRALEVLAAVPDERERGEDGETRNKISFGCSRDDVERLIPGYDPEEPEVDETDYWEGRRGRWGTKRQPEGGGG